MSEEKLRQDMEMDQKLQESILDNAAQIQEHRKVLHEVREKCIEAKEDLKSTECDLINVGIPGKNEKEREAYIRLATAEERETLIVAEKAERIAALNLELSLDARRSLENIIKLMEVENGH